MEIVYAVNDYLKRIKHTENKFTANSYILQFNSLIYDYIEMIKKGGNEPPKSLLEYQNKVSNNCSVYMIYNNDFGGSFLPCLSGFENYSERVLSSLFDADVRLMLSFIFNIKK